jgi:hypothetical protein
MDDNNISIKENNKQYETIYQERNEVLNITSTSSPTDEESNPMEIEDNKINTEEFEDPDLMEHFVDNLSDTAQKVIQIMMDPPDGYVQKYGEKPVKKYIAEYLKLNNRQIKEIWFELKMTYCDIIGSPD